MCYDCRLFYFHKASGTFQRDQQSQGLVDGTVIYLPPGSTYILKLEQISTDGAVLVLNFDLVLIQTFCGFPALALSVSIS